MRRYAGRAIVVLAVTFGGLQLTTPARLEPVIDQALTLEWNEAVPADVARTLDVACRDCHSDRTNWSWHTSLAPMSWWTQRHVMRGRAELNFSVWGTYGRRLRDTRLRAMCALTENHEMPLYSYALVHPEARLSDGEIRQLCAWTERLIAEYAD